MRSSFTAISAASIALGCNWYDEAAPTVDAGVAHDARAPFAFDAWLPPFVTPEAGGYDTSCDFERFTAEDIAQLVGAPVLFTGLRKSAADSNEFFVDVLAPGLGRTWTVQVRLSYASTEYELLAPTGSPDAGASDATATPDASSDGSVPVDSGAGQDARADAAFPMDAAAPDGAPPEVGTAYPACQTPLHCANAELSDDPLCIYFSDTWVSGVTREGRAVLGPRVEGGSDYDCTVEMGPVGFPIGYSGYACGIGGNPVVLTAYGLYATCNCYID